MSLNLLYFCVNYSTLIVSLRYKYSMLVMPCSHHMLLFFFLCPDVHFLLDGMQPLFPGESGVDQLVEIIKV